MNKTIPTLVTGSTAVALILATAAYAQEPQAEFARTSYATERFEVERFAGTLEIIADAEGEMTAEAFGPEDKMERLEIRQDGETLEIEFTERDFSWSDWSTWLRWWSDSNFDPEDYPTVIVHLPVGSEIEIDNFTGNVEIGDTYGDIAIAAAGVLDGSVGHVTSAELDIAGAADLRLGDVDELLHLDVAGAADIDAGNVAEADVSINGAADVTLGDVAGDLEISAAGAGDVRAASVNGAVDISLAGAGNVRIEAGYATSFDVSIAGMGDVWFGGTAVDPDVSIAGMGDVYIHAYEGRLSHSGMGDLEIGSGS